MAEPKNTERTTFEPKPRTASQPQDAPSRPAEAPAKTEPRTNPFLDEIDLFDGSV